MNVRVRFIIGDPETYFLESCSYVVRPRGLKSKNPLYLSWFEKWFTKKNRKRIFEKVSSNLCHRFFKLMDELYFWIFDFLWEHL